MKVIIESSIKHLKKKPLKSPWGKVQKWLEIGFTKSKTSSKRKFAVKPHRKLTSFCQTNFHKLGFLSKEGVGDYWMCNPYAFGFMLFWNHERKKKSNLVTLVIIMFSILPVENVNDTNSSIHSNKVLHRSCQNFCIEKQQHSAVCLAFSWNVFEYKTQYTIKTHNENKFHSMFCCS